MKILKSHFWYNKSQRNGVFFLVILIVILQIVYVFVDFSSREILNTDTEELKKFQAKIDSLKKIEIEKRKPKLYPFNPNFITDFKGYQLGMTVEEIDRLHNFRKHNKYVNSAKEFQEITKVEDSLLVKISPYFKFPDWVVKKNQSKKVARQQVLEKSSKEVLEDEKIIISTNDINKATQEDFETISGGGEVISQRILKTFQIIHKPIIQKVNVNTASFKEVLKNPYVNYELCKKIFDYRDEVAELQNISELRNIKDFPLDKYSRIILYLEAK